MLDLRFIRNNPDIVKRDLQKRGRKEKLEVLDELLSNDSERRKLQVEGDELRARRNQVTRGISEAIKAGEKRKADELKKEASKIPGLIRENEDRAKYLDEEIAVAVRKFPNILHHSVPVGKDGSDNAVVRKWPEGKEPKKPHFELKVHGELAEENGWADFSRAAKASGAGFAYLLGDLARLDFALQLFALDTLEKRGFTIIEVPLMVDKAPYEGVTDLADFETMMYKIEGMDKYLIATSEHAIAAMHAGDIFEPEDLPVRLAGVSPCFRKEIGSHGVDTRGLFRMHQFNKVEQFVFCKQEESWKIFDELIANAELIFQKLGLPYRIVSICTGDIGTVAAKKLDLEVWMPREAEYKEAVSCSNCTDYQAVGLSVKYRTRKGGEEKEYCHTLNSTAVATSRAMRSILENCQQKDGSVLIPKALQPYMNGLEKLRPVKRPKTT
ncbi:serine--tRNA ligase [Candidatus Micrarchaeota archaeon]|nr:serine--tRNA ligase [Candidatus Micrarchaeota archaeon]MBI5177228.1 serine--tRNA ligase [Candidatus Micrarchaeota archaeon]